MSNKYPFLNKWLDEYDSVESSYEKYIDSFLSQFEFRQRLVIIKMLNRYSFYNHIQKEKMFLEYVDKINEFIAGINNKGEYRIVTPIKDNKPHNSDIFGVYFKDEDFFERNISDDVLSACNHLFVVDDYSGTGDTIIKFLSEKLKQGVLKQKTVVYAIPVFMTNEALHNLSAKGIKVNTNISVVRQAKFYTQQNIINSAEKMIFDEASLKLCRVQAKYLNGYEKTEDLFSLPYATPNNTFGLFWSDSNTLYRPLFSRKGEQVFSMKSERFKHDFLKAADAMLIDGRIKALDIKKRFSIYIPILMLAGCNFGDIKQMLGLDNNKYFKYKGYLLDLGIIDGGDNIDIDELSKYVDMDKFRVFIGMRVLPVDSAKQRYVDNLMKEIQRRRPTI